VTAVTITPNAGKSNGAQTVSYEGINSTDYSKKTDVPTAVGTYAVTFNVAAVTLWNEANDLYAGILEVNSNPIPVAADYTLGNAEQVEGAVTTVTLTPGAGKSDGAVSNIKYEGSSDIPQTSGEYTVTFDVAAGTTYNAAAGLTAANKLVVTKKVLDSGFVLFWADKDTGVTTQAGGSLTIVPTTGSVTFQMQGTASIKGWYVNGASVGQTGASYIFTGFAAGTYRVSVVVLIDGKLYNSPEQVVTVKAN